MNKPIVRFYRNPQLKEIELRFSQYRQHAFTKHAHDTYSIGLIQQGKTQFVHQRETFLIGEGDIALINPGEAHACNPQPGSNLKYFMLYIDSQFLQNLAAQIDESAKNLLQFQKPVVHDPALYSEFELLFQGMLEGVEILEIESRLYAALSSLILIYSSGYNPYPQVHQQNAIVLGCDYLRHHLGENVSLHFLADLCGLSPYHFLRQFNDEIGFPPHTYQLQLRIQEARRRLAGGETSAQVAVELGFADQSHLIRTFKSMIGATPGQYQANAYKEINEEDRDFPSTR